MATLELQGLTKRFGEFTAVDSMNLKAAEGEMIALLGGSGCGKTTTLRMIAGFTEPTARTDPGGRQKRFHYPPLPPQYRHFLPELRAVPPHDGF